MLDGQRNFEATLKIYDINHTNQLNEFDEPPAVVWTNKDGTISEKETATLLTAAWDMMLSVATFITQRVASLVSLVPGINLNKSSSKSHIPGGPGETPKGTDTGTGKGPGPG